QLVQRLRSTSMTFGGQDRQAHSIGILRLDVIDHHVSIAPRQMYLISRYSSKPSAAPSRPRPDSLTPPNGTTSLEKMPSLTPTMPASSFSATRRARLKFWLKR